MTMQQVHIERLRTLYSILPGIPDARVKLHRWGFVPASTLDVTACAAGWACLHPELRAQGLIFYTKPEGKGRKSETEGQGMVPKHGDQTGWYAITSFFGIDFDSAWWIFGGGSMGHGAAAKRRVMSRIRRRLEKEGAITPERSAELALQEEKL